MKTILLTMTALAALGAAAPASAQPWQGHMSQTASLQMQLDAGMRTGAISWREGRQLRASLRDLITLERQFGRNGFSGSENATLRQRSNELRREIRFAERDGRYGDRMSAGERDHDGHDSRDGYGNDGDGRDGWNGQGERGASYGVDPRFGQPNRGDRFSGDGRGGYPSTARMIAMPDRYREAFRDTDDVYYRYDAGRIFRINRATNMVIALFDIQN